MRIDEITTAKIDKVKPGVEATVDNGDGTKTVVDLKKNPNALVKDPATKKIKLNKKPQTGTATDPAKTPKPGDSVEVE